VSPRITPATALLELRDSDRSIGKPGNDLQIPYGLPDGTVHAPALGAGLLLEPPASFLTAEFPLVRLGLDQQQPPSAVSPGGSRRCRSWGPGASGRWSRSTSVVFGCTHEQRYAPAPRALGDGSWHVLRLQLLPDGRLGLAIDGKPLAITAGSTRLDRPFRVRDDIDWREVRQRPIGELPGISRVHTGFTIGSSTGAAAFTSDAGLTTPRQLELVP
jgi:hypothetical protein